MVANDLTKLFEQLDRGNIRELIVKFKAEAPRGEYTVVISGLNPKNSSDSEESSLKKRKLTDAPLFIPAENFKKWESRAACRNCQSSSEGAQTEGRTNDLSAG